MCEKIQKILRTKQSRWCCPCALSWKRWNCKFRARVRHPPTTMCQPESDRTCQPESDRLLSGLPSMAYRSKGIRHKRVMTNEFIRAEWLNTTQKVSYPEESMDTVETPVRDADKHKHRYSINKDEIFRVDLIISRNEVTVYGIIIQLPYPIHIAPPDGLVVAVRMSV